MSRVDVRSAENSRPTDRRLQGLAGQERDEPKPNYKMTVEGCRQAYPRLTNCGRLTSSISLEEREREKGEKRR
jgi:hypothetical protein